MSDWLTRRDAIKQVLEKACIELGYLAPSSDAWRFNIVIEGSEDNQDEIRDGLGRDIDGELYEGAPLMLGPLREQTVAFGYSVDDTEALDGPPTEGMLDTLLKVFRN